MSLDYNLVSDPSNCTFMAASHDLTNAAAHLGPLQNNGGPTATQALLPGSAAIDAANPAGCHDDTGAPVAIDQRGAARPINNPGCDIGAFELDLFVYLPLLRR